MRCTEPPYEFVVEFLTQYVLRKDTAGDTLSFFFSDEGTKIQRLYLVL